MESTLVAPPDVDVARVAGSSSAPNDRPLIRLRGIQKIFSVTQLASPALEGIDLDIFPGEYLAITGPSGCGKTTLLSILGLLDVPTGGEYLLQGQAVTSLTRTQQAHVRNRQIGFIFQAFYLIGELTVFENVERPLIYRRDMTPSERRGRVWDALQRVELSDRVTHYPSQLSGGQQQRVAVARAIAGGPSILLADEPTGNLDSKSGANIMALLGELHRAGTTICVVTHDPRYLSEVQRTVYVLDGRVVGQDGSQLP